MNHLELRQYMVFCHPDQEDLGKSLQKRYPSNFFLQEVIWRQFADLTPNIQIPSLEEAEDRHVIFIANFMDTQLDRSKRVSRFSQLSVIRALVESRPESFTLLLPFSPAATMERTDERRPGVIVSANTDAFFLGAALEHQGVRCKAIIFDLHTLQNQFYQKMGSFTKMVTAVPMFRRVIVDPLQKKTGNVVIAFPDGGACKRFGGQFDGYKEVICGKSRGEDGNQRIITIKDGEQFINGSHVIIVDDLVQTGGTIYNCMNILKDRNADMVSCYVTHVVLPNNSWKKFMPDGIYSGFDTFWCTDTSPAVARIIDGMGPFKVLPIVDEVAKCLLRRY